MFPFLTSQVKKKSKLLRGFTVIELIVTVIIISILSSLAIAKYEITITKHMAKKAMMDMYTIYAAQEMRKAKTGQFWVPFSGAFDEFLTDMNAALKLNISADSGVIYMGNFRPGGGSDGFLFTAAKIKGSQFIVTLSDAGPGQGPLPFCSGTCP